MGVVTEAHQPQVEKLRAALITAFKSTEAPGFGNYGHCPVSSKDQIGKGRSGLETEKH